MLCVYCYHSEEPVFGVRVAQSLFFCVAINIPLFVLLPFGHCIVCPSSIYGFWLPFPICNLFMSFICYGNQLVYVDF